MLIKDSDARSETGFWTALINRVSQFLMACSLFLEEHLASSVHVTFALLESFDALIESTEVHVFGHIDGLSEDVFLGAEG